MLEKIVEATVEAVARRKREVSLSFLEASLPSLPPVRDFRGALSGADCAVIAEIKRSSPSAGRILEDFDPPALARAFRKGGAAAVSVLTEERFFEGRLSFISLVRGEISVPVLRKDFIIDPYQILETRVNGGDALLLITGLLGAAKLREFLDRSRSLGLACLVEVHDRSELETALWAGADIIGINNRNLKTFHTDLAVSETLAPLVPPGVITVSESAIRSRDDILRLQRAGIRAFLVGEFLSRSPDPASALLRLRGEAAQR